MDSVFSASDQPHGLHSPKLVQMQHSRIDSPIVTTVLTTYRRPRLVKRAIHSVLRQTYSNIRLLVLDDASGDETEEIVETIAQQDPRVVYVKHPHNIGMTPNWQYGLEHVETPYFSFLSDDDLLLPHFYSVAVQALEADTSIDFVGGTTIVFDENGTIGYIMGDRWQPGIHNPPEAMLHMMADPLSWNAILFRHDIVAKVDGLENIHSTDYDYLVRAARNCKFQVLNQPFAMFMEHSGRGLGYTNREQIFDEFFPMAQRLLNPQGLPPEVQAGAWAIMNRYCFTTARYLVLSYLIGDQPHKALKVSRLNN